MATDAQKIAALLKVADYLFNKATEGVSEEKANQQIAEKANSFLWIAGHITHSRYSVLRVFGVDLDLSWTEVFKRGNDYSKTTDYPALSDIHKAWRTASDKLMETVGGLSDEDLSKEAPGKYPSGDNTIGGMLRFISYHESHHIGQLSYIRTCLGLDGLVK